MRGLSIGMTLLVAAAAAPACRSAADLVPADAAPLDPDVPVETLADLRFAVVGDTRPINLDDTANYPTAVITRIWQDVAAMSPPASFAVSTGDYMFASVSAGQASPQLDLYLGARAAYGGKVYAAMGNHECTGATASNCGAGNSNGETANYKAYLQRMVTPLGFAHPWFDAVFQAPDKSWTAKVVVVAGNAWGADQAAWLDQALAVPTTYTFVIRHESDSADTAPGVIPSAKIIGAHPLTLQIVGHTHTYSHYGSSREVIVGNGGAPLSGGVNYGYATVERRADGNILFEAHDYMSNAVVDSFVVGADGAPR